MSLLPFFQWMQDCALSKLFQGSVWASPIIQVIHLCALGVFAGSILIVDLRLLGRGLKRQPVAQVARDAQPWMIGALLLLLVTGIPQVTSLAIKEYYSSFFWWKMEGLVVGLIFTFTLRRWVALGDEARMGPFWPKVAGLFSLALWTGVTVGARMIGLT